MYRIFLAAVTFFTVSCATTTVQPTLFASPVASSPVTPTPHSISTSLPVLPTIFPTAPPTSIATTIPTTVATLTSTIFPTPTLRAPNQVSPTQVRNISFQMEPKWVEGDVRKVELTKQGRRTGQAEIITRTNIEITVLDITAGGYIIQWKYGETKFDDPKIASDPNISALLALGNGLRIEYETDRSGAFSQLRNWQELKTLFDRAIVESATVMRRAGQSEELISKVLTETQRMFSTKEQIETFALNEINVYHLPYGITFQTSTPLEYDALHPNPFGGDPFPSRGIFQVQEYDVVAGRVIIQWSQTIDPERGKAVLLKTLTDMATRLGNPPPKEIDLPAPFKIEYTSTYVIDTGTGWIQSLEYSQNTVIGPQFRIDTTRITDKSK